MKKINIVIILAALVLLATGCKKSGVNNEAPEVRLTDVLAWGTLTPEEVKGKVAAMGLPEDKRMPDSYSTRDYDITLRQLSQVLASFKLSTIHRSVMEGWEKTLTENGYTLEEKVAPSGEFAWHKLYVKKTDKGQQPVMLLCLDDDDTKDMGVFAMDVYLVP